MQFPIVDARQFYGVDRLDKPPWGLLVEHEHYLPHFGAAMLQRNFEHVPSVWRDDRQYVGAQWALRVRGKPLKHDLSLIGVPPKNLCKKQFFWAYQAPIPETGFCFSPAFRRLHSDGFAVSRLDVGFWVFGGREVGGFDAIRLVRDLLSLQTEVDHHGSLAQRKCGDLGDQGRALADLYGQCTTRRASGVSGEQVAGLVLAGAPAVFLDDTMGVEDLPGDPSWFRKIGRQLGMPKLTDFPEKATIVSGQTAGSLDLAYTTLKIIENKKGGGRKRRFGLWMIRGRPPVSREVAAASQGIRTSLLRMHATRQGLSELARLASSRPPLRSSDAEKKDPFETYVKKLAKQVLPSSSQSAELQYVVSQYDLGDGGNEGATLKIALDNLPLSRQLKEQVRKSIMLQSPLLEGCELEGKIVMIGTYTNINLVATDSAQLTVHDITQVAGDNIVQAKGNTLKARDSELRGALAELNGLVESLAKRREPEGQEFASRKLKQLSEEAVAEQPDVELLKVSGKGLIEAAKTVSELVGPITAAVMGVLGIFGVTL